MGQREYESLTSEADELFLDGIDRLDFDAEIAREDQHPEDCHCIECVLDAAIEEHIDYA